MRTNYLYLFFAVVLTFLMASCSKDDYARVIPASAEIVVSVDIDDLAEQGDFAHSTSMDFIKQSINVLCSGKSKSDACNYLDDPAKLGLDLRIPVYLFKTADNYVGFVAKVYDDDKVGDFVSMLHEQGLSSKIVEKDGRNTATILDDILVSYDGTSFVALASTDGVGINSVNQHLKALLELKKEERFTSTLDYERMSGDDEHKLILYGNMGLFPDNVAVFLKPLVPQNVRLSELSLFTALDFENGKLVVDVEVEPKTDNAREAMDLINSNMQPIKGKYLETVPENFLMFLTVNSKGEWLLQNLKGMPNVNEYLTLLERAIDIEQMIRSIDGDISIIMPKIAYHELKNTEIPDFIITAEIAKKDFLADVPYWTESMREYGVSMRQTDKDCYVMRRDNNEICWGVQDSEIYFASASAFRSNAMVARSPMVSQYADLIRESCIFTLVNMKSVPLVDFYQIPVLGRGIQHLKSFIVRTSNANQMQFIIELDNADENFLKAIW